MIGEYNRAFSPIEIPAGYLIQTVHTPICPSRAFMERAVKNLRGVDCVFVENVENTQDWTMDYAWMTALNDSLGVDIVSLDGASDNYSELEIVPYGTVEQDILAVAIGTAISLLFSSDERIIEHRATLKSTHPEVYKFVVEARESKWCEKIASVGRCVVVAGALHRVAFL